MFPELEVHRSTGLLGFAPANLYAKKLEATESYRQENLHIDITRGGHTKVKNPASKCGPTP